jgi:hypothetical protein
MHRFLTTLFVLVLFAAFYTGCEKQEKSSTETQTDPEWKLLVNLTGEWKFSVGDNPEWSSPNLSDDNWEKIEVPSSWENQGFHGYDGYAWYRNTFELPGRYKNNIIYIFLGYIDDVDQVFINGKLIGFSGSFPPSYRTAYNVFRRYPVPAEVLKFNGKNTIAIRVYDDELEGGILRGDIGLFTPGYSLQNGITLIGTWKFKTGDSLTWKNSDYDDSDWTNIIVPGYWEGQGFPDYDGFAWYRRTVFVPKKLKDEKLILMLGKVDDFDEVYINGKLIGSTGQFNNLTNLGDYYLKLRTYYLSTEDLKYGAKNLIAVRVYDGFRDGGIYQGPVSILTQSEYRDYWNSIRHGENFIEKVFN